MMNETKFMLINRKALLGTVLVISFPFAVSVSYAALTFSSSTIMSDGALNLTTANGLIIPGHSAMGAEATIDGSSPLFPSFDYRSVLNIREQLDHVSDGGEDNLLALFTTLNTPGPISTNAAVLADLELQIPSANSTDFTTPIQNIFFETDHDGSGDVAEFDGFYGFIKNNGAGVVDNVYGAGVNIYNQGTGSITHGYGFYTKPFAGVGGNIGNFYGFYATPPQGTIGVNYSFYAADQANPGGISYYSWFDSRGVGRCKEDNTFNSVGQSICAVYNPQFAKYTPSAANYERIVYGQWNSNVAEIGTEAGGTGTLRALRLLGSEVDANANLVVSGSLRATTTTFSGLATCNAAAEGTQRPVTDSATSTWGATITGSGSNHVLAYCNGTNWTVMAK